MINKWAITGPIFFGARLQLFLRWDVAVAHDPIGPGAIFPPGAARGWTKWVQPLYSSPIVGIKHNQIPTTMVKYDDKFVELKPTWLLSKSVYN
jgi:hypothetical protein